MMYRAKDFCACEKHHVFSDSMKTSNKGHIYQRCHKHFQPRVVFLPDDYWRASLLSGSVTFSLLFPVCTSWYSCHSLWFAAKPHYKSSTKDNKTDLHLVLGNVGPPEEVFTERDSRRALEIRLVQRKSTGGELQINPLPQMFSCLTKTHYLSVGKPLS